jgi:hypothetical protein
MAALLLQVSLVPQSWIPVTSKAGNRATPAVTQPEDVALDASGSVQSDSLRPEQLSAESQPRPVPGVAYAPGRLRLEPVAPALSSLETGLPLNSAAAAAPAFLSGEAEAQTERRSRRLWEVLSVAQHSTAAFDAWSTRKAISSGRGRELNPLLRPFAGNASLYVAIQAGPVLLDFVGQRMMTSRHGWMRHTWWVPQAAGTVMSLFSGFHNLNVASQTAVP